MYRNNDLIYEATSKLEELINVPIQVDSNRADYDALLTVYNTQFVVESRSAVRTSNQGLILSQLEELKNNNSRPIILIAEYISKKATQELKERGINYIDVAGNAYIKHQDLAIFIEGQKSTKKDKTNQSRAFQETGLKIIFHLLNKPENLQDSYRRIAEQADVSVGSVSNVMAELEALNYLLKTNDKRVLKNKTELVERWVVDYNATLRPRILRKRMRFIDQEHLRNWQNIDLHTATGSILWGGEPGGAILTESLRPEKFTIFTDLDLSYVANKLRLVPSEEGAVEVLQKFWKNNETNNQVAPPLLVYADLMNSGYGRNIETAKKILENELQHI
ncbi:type IV toxin-antitoxin system AbiEi family antitoxin [Aequorivita marina]|uniref:type IV toxin-antitoxin system AbiEi family antitoxin n=1 Tax=Aequorivita marina TaxID=3073654 RepID=UPI0028757415|nr:type IV toxin-antitoxin system AbiEi family antitoxin [Aequorivita sp. S2608]MDS1297078.1 type IV toxin-antitoxin system AbiEi family antitoxin [Aequorivita sp. S2608]